MIPVNPKSKLTAKAWVDTVNAATCAPSWMKKIFTFRGTDFRIAPSYKFITGKGISKPPAWFGVWHTAASSVYMGSNWELTTGTLEMKPKDLSLMVPDGISIGKLDPDKNWTDFPQMQGHDKGEGGITVPTQDIKDNLNTQKDGKLHYSGVIVKPGSKQGEIVVVTQIKSVDGQLLSFGPNDVIETLFHELFHAGQIDQNKPNADSDTRFSAVTDGIKSFFACP
ncbi:MAG: hypothetical protein ABI197_00535 [Granulicella sp.]